jgi:hypothetical protein
LIEGSGEQKGGNCVCAEALKPEIEVAGFAYAQVSILANADIDVRAYQ